MKLIKSKDTEESLKSEPFSFRPIDSLTSFDIFATYLEGESPEYKNDMEKVFMVLEGNMMVKVNDEDTKISTGDLIILQSGEKFQFNTTDGAKILQFQRSVIDEVKAKVKAKVKGKVKGKVKTIDSEKVMELACARHPIKKFIDEPVLKKDIYYILKSGMYAPSSANRQPWKFVVVGDAELKRKIRETAEMIEKKNLEKYKKLGNLQDQDLQKNGLAWQKPFLENAPFLICVFGDRKQKYYKESLWLAIGWMLLAAEELGLATLTYRPVDLRFLNKLLNINGNYSTELILPIGYAEKSDTTRSKKDYYDVVSWV